ncbi:MAG: Asp-tRNA(Asn)/Glu-tRNA(Gln) amidotransferase subunit GatC [Clostridia bacterium]
MTISDLDVKKIANLAKLEFSEDEIENMKKVFSGMKDLLSIMDEINVKDSLPDRDFCDLRADKEEKSLPKSDVLKNAPESSEGYFTVPRIVG